LVDPERL